VGETSRTIRGTIIDGFGDDQEGYLLVVNGDRMGRKNLLVIDAVTGKPLASMGVKPILSMVTRVKVTTCQRPVKSSSFL